MRNCILLTLFLVAGLFSNNALNAQQTAAKETNCKKETVAKVSCQSAEADAKQAVVPVFLEPQVTRVAMTDEGAKASCLPANCKPANCDPADCKPANCDPAKCPPECLALCKEGKVVKASHISDMPVKTVAAQPSCKSHKETKAVEKT